MSEWDTGSQEFDDPNPPSGRQSGYSTGGLHWLMSVMCLLIVGAVSFGMAYLMKDVVRNFFTMGLTFAAPFAALMGSALLTEKAASRMVPACSRKAQMLFAAGTVVAAFVFGGLAEVFHKPVVIMHNEPQYDYVIVEDKSGSMTYMEEDCRKAIRSMLADMSDENRVGYVSFASDVLGQADIRELDQLQRSRIDTIIAGNIPGWANGTNFTDAMNTAVRLIEKDEKSDRPVRIILVTDGDSAAHGDFQSFTRWYKSRGGKSGRRDVELDAIQLGAVPMLQMVKDAVKMTEGNIFDRTDISKLAENLGKLKSEVLTPEPVDTLKATYNGQTADGKPNTAYVILTAVLLLLLGLLCGFSLMIMFSLRGQFRFQVILSALMGVTAFLLLNYGKSMGIEPAWICEGIAFSLFGLVFMRTNSSVGHSSGRIAAPAEPQPAGGFDDF